MPFILLRNQKDQQTHGIVAFNDYIQQDPRVEKIMGSVLLIILPTFELLQTKHQLVLTVVGFLPPKRA